MTTDGKKYYDVILAGWEEDAYVTIEATDEFSSCSQYDFYDVKKMLKDTVNMWHHGNRNQLDYSGLCEADRNALDEYVNNLTRESTFDTDFATDADYADGFVESDGARMERESFIPNPVDDEYDEPDGGDKEME